MESLTHLYLARSKMMLAFTVVPSLRRRDALSAERQGYGRVATDGIIFPRARYMKLRTFRQRIEEWPVLKPEAQAKDRHLQRPSLALQASFSRRLQHLEEHGSRSAQLLKACIGPVWEAFPRSFKPITRDDSTAAQELGGRHRSLAVGLQRDDGDLPAAAAGDHLPIGEAGNCSRPRAAP